MELNADLIAIQGILMSTMKSTGEFTKINNRGGNEQKILNVMMEIQKYISSKNYIMDGEINTKYEKQLDNIVFFLAINTMYKEPLDLDEYDHLMNIMPQLSKCLLVNIVYGLDLCKYYCRVIEKLPTSYGIELLEEMIPCLKKSVPKVQLCYTFMFLKAAIIKLISIGNIKQEEDNIDKISTVTNIMLQNLTGLSSDHARNWKALQIYNHMGYCLLRLFELLLYCDKNNPSLDRFIKNVLRTCCTVVKNITINVYCSWAEIEEDDQPLQNIISEKAYLVVEEYQKHEEAKELLSMLSTMARKPKTLGERIQEADISTIVKNINKCNPDQKSWFQALLNTRLFESKEAVACVNKWAHLCDEDDVTRLLNLGFQSNNKEANALAVKCAAMLPLEKLTLVTVRYYYKNKFKYSLKEDVQPQLMIIFNKAVGKTETDEEFVKEISLLLLQNPAAVISYIYSECLKNSFYSRYLEGTFATIKEIAKIDSIGVKTLEVTMSKIKIDSDNIENYVELFRTLLQTNYFSSDVVFALLYNVLQKSYEEKSAEDLNYVLQIYMGLDIRIPVKEENRSTIELLLNIMDNCRCIFVEFDSLKQQNVKYVVDIIMGLCDISANYNFKGESKMDCDEFTSYYSKYLSNEVDCSLLKYTCPDFSTDNYAKCVSDLLKVLPRSVTLEWLNIAEEIYKEFGSEKTMELLADVLLLLCQTVTQSSNNELIVALKYCIQHYGMTVQRIQENATLHVEVSATKHLCRLLRYIPDTLKEEEGLSLINVLTERSLKSLANEREFVCLLISINNKKLCQILAQKITS